MPPDPYDDPYDVATGAVTPAAAAFGQGDPATLQGMLGRHQQAAAGREVEARGVMDQQAAQTAKMMELLDSTANRIRERRSGGTNLPLLALGAGMMGPGDFGTQVGRGLRAMIPAIQQERAAEDETEQKLMGLEVQKAKLANLPLEQRLAYIRAMQQGDAATIRSIETQLAKATGAANKPKTGREALAQRLIDEAAKRGETLTFDAALERLQSLSERQPAELQMLEQYKKDTKNPNAGIIEMKKDVAWNQAYARKTGEMTGTNRMGLETTEQNVQRASTTVDELLADEEGMKYAVGSLLANVPPMYGSKKADFLGKHEYLTKQVYATAVQDMRGLGALSEMEGLAIANSKLNAARTQSKEAYKKALVDFKTQINRSYDIARRNAGVSPARDFSQPAAPITSMPEGVSPTPPGQTSLRPQTFKEGAIADGPNGPMIFQNGKWISHGR